MEKEHIPSVNTKTLIRMYHCQPHTTIISSDVGTFDSSNRFLMHLLEQIAEHDRIAIKSGQFWRLDSAHRT